ncbi:MAG: PEP-CTERM sorting domain-containing protein [Acidobacteria bacterium]|nr:PEP-CTERM sorting domain-containing protein [Acidobacteriota bacterium]
MRRVALALFVLAMSAISLPAITIIDTMGDWDGGITNGWQLTAQTIIAPADNVLTDYQFVLAPRAGAGSITFSVYAWSGGPTGPALYSTVIPWSTGGLVDISGISVPLVTGNLYGMLIDLQGYSGMSVHYQSNQTSYSAANAWWGNGTLESFPGLNHSFHAEFNGGQVPEPGTLSLLALGAGFMLLRRVRQ